MPWKAFKVGNEFCVFRIDESDDRTGRSLGCHSSRAKANRQVAALNISERKEQPVDELVDEPIVKVPDNPILKEVEDLEEKDHLGRDDFQPTFGAMTFEELDEAEEQMEKAEAVGEAASIVPSLVRNVMFGAEPDDRPALLTKIADGFKTRIADLSTKMKSKLQGETKAINAFLVTKDEALDRFVWFSSYSNNIRDTDDPPEIIASQSHEAFVKGIDTGAIPLPELWLWHIPSLKIGTATWVAYDKSNGIAMAAGIFDKEAEAVAEHLATLEGMGVSHGMHAESIRRDDTDKTIITSHITKEVSPLPQWAAANKWADFLAELVILKETNMSIDDAKKDVLTEQFGFKKGLLDEIEERNSKTSKAADAVGLERKETAESPAEEPAEEAVEAPETPDEAATEETPAVAPESEPAVEGGATEEAPTEPVEPTAFSEPQVKELAEAFVGFEGRIFNRLEEVLAPINDRLGIVERDDAEKVKEQVENTTLASLLFGPSAKSATSADETKIDGRTKLNKGPKENKDKIPKNGIGWQPSNPIEGAVKNIVNEGLVRKYAETQEAIDQAA